MLTRAIIIFLFSLMTCNADAQLYVGITGDLGNRVKVEHNINAWIHHPTTFSGSITFYKKEHILNDWCLQYGVAVGVMGYRIKASEADTFANDPHFYDIYSSYSTLYTSGHFSVGKQFTLHQHKVAVFLGGGATYYFDFIEIQSGSSSGVWTGSSFETVFDYKMHLTPNKVKAFVEISLQTQLNARISVGMQYRYHFKPAATGTYNFYHTRESASGSLSLTQRALSLLFLIRLGKISPHGD